MRQDEEEKITLDLRFDPDVLVFSSRRDRRRDNSKIRDAYKVTLPCSTPVLQFLHCCRLGLALTCSNAALPLS